MDRNLVNFLKESGTLITPSRRLASSLLTQANEFLNQQACVWQTPRIYALQDWLLAIWQQLEIAGVATYQLLTPSQSLLLWTTIIRTQPAGKTLLNVSATAKMARQAWGLLQQWLIGHSWDEPAENLNLDQQTFKAFASAYEQWLMERQALDSVQLASVIQRYLVIEHQAAWQRISPVKQLLFYGFEERYPLLEQLIESLQAQEWQIHFQEPNTQIPSLLGRKAFYDSELELRAAVQFAQTKLAEGKKRIGIVVPDLANMRKQVDKTLKEVFEPLAICEPVAKVSENYNISAATPLDHYPIIHSAVCWLKIVKGTFTLSTHLQTISSPFFAWQSNDLSELLQHYVQLQKRKQSQLSLTKISQSMVNVTWLEIYHKVAEYLATLPKQLPYAKWAEHFQQLLLLAGWPGPRTLSSVEHQIVNRWHEALAEIRLVDSVQEPVTYFEALATLRSVIAQIPFQAQSQGARVQVLGILEALGLPFDSLWVLGLHSEAWPPQAKPNPLIPLTLQKQLKMPHASSEREMAYAHTMTERLRRSADEVIFSYPQTDRAKTLSCSELIRSLPELPLEPAIALTPYKRLEERFIIDNALETLIDQQAPAVSLTEKIAATTHLLTSQAACPFKAFAEIRLQATRIEKADDWLASSEQGIILHEVLQRFWQITQTQAELLTIPQETLAKSLSELIEEVLYQYVNPSMPQPYLQVEKNRLLIILSDYLELEKLRSPFTVRAVESQRQFDLAGLTFRIRLDRIDTVHDEGTVLIDYKSGQFNVADIWGERPKAPQLPLYYLSAIHEQPQALVVAKLNRAVAGYEGICQHSIGIQGIKPLKGMAWHALQSYWTETLSALVTSFTMGKAMVDPLDPNTTCRYCDLSAFCRINEREIS